MRRNILTTVVLCLSVLVAIAVGPAGAADKKAKEGQITGTVHMIDKATSTITVQKGTTTRQVVYNADTKWMYGTQASVAVREFRDARRVLVGPRGRFGAEQTFIYQAAGENGSAQKSQWTSTGLFRPNSLVALST